MTPHKKQNTHSNYIHPLALHKHLAKHFHKHLHKIFHVYRDLHHTFLHVGEMLVITMIGLSGFMLANFTGSLEGLERHNSAEVASYLLQAINHPQDILTKGNLISVWTMDESVYTTFATGYCTYGAARISPEFFPFIDSKTQQRTWGGNAVNRCENAAATGFKIGNTPAQGALVIYDAGGRFGAYGHVGKVMHYDRGIDKIIVRDMAWVSRDVMSDHRETASNPEIKCYIYSNGQTPVTPPTQSSTGTTQTGTQHTGTIVVPPVVIPPVAAPSHPASSTTGTTTPIVTPPAVTPPAIIPPVVIPSIPTIQFDFDTLGDLGKHLVGLRDMEATLDGGSTTMNVGDERVLTITIKDKKTQENIVGLLPLALDFIASQDSIRLDYATVKLINDGKIELHIRAVQKGTSSLIINFGGDKIAKIGFIIQ